MLGVFKSTNNGGSFSMSNTGLSSAWIQAFAICQGNLFTGSGEEGVFVSSDVGSSWSPVNTGLSSLNILSMASDGVNVYAGTSDSGIFISGDLGANWLSINYGLNSNTITAIEFVNGYLFAGTKEDGIYMSYDQGANWNQMSTGLPSQANIRCLYVNDTIIFTGTGDGAVFTSLDYGNTWLNISGGLSGSPVLSLWAFEDYLYAGMNAEGVWKFPLSLITGTNEIETNIKLHIYPNPSSDMITVETAQVYDNSFLSLYSMTGQELIKQDIEGHRTQIDISTLTPGIYLVKYGSKDRVSTSSFVKE